jgi:hypothetical protein
MKINLHLSLPATCFLLILTTSCKKDHTEPPPPAVNATFSMKDTLIIESQYATLAPDIYNKYNGKTYRVNSEKLKLYAHEKINNNVVFYFEDLSSGILIPSAEIIIKNTNFSMLLPEYNLADTTHIQVNCYQQFDNNTKAYRVNEKVKSGVLKINYNNKYRTVSGEITNLSTPISFYVPDDPQPNRISTGILILQGGSTRTISLKYDFVRTDDM